MRAIAGLHAPGFLLLHPRGWHSSFRTHQTLQIDLETYSRMLVRVAVLKFPSLKGSLPCDSHTSISLGPGTSPCFSTGSVASRQYRSGSQPLWQAIAPVCRMTLEAGGEPEHLDSSSGFRLRAVLWVLSELRIELHPSRILKQHS